MQRQWERRAGVNVTEGTGCQGTQTVQATVQNLDFVLSENPTCSPGISLLCFWVGICVPTVFSVLYPTESPQGQG